MSDEIDVTDLKRCSRVRGERTLQFYAVRNKWKWLLSVKTRDPVEFMKKRWGKDIDVITLLACEPQEVNRDWRRYESQYEVVDCGRSKRRAQTLLDALKNEAYTERALQRKAKETVEEETVESWQAGIDVAEAKRKKLVRLIEEDGLLALLGTYDFDDRAEEAAHADICAWGLKALNEEPEEGKPKPTVDDVLVRMREHVLTTAMNFSPAGFGIRGLDDLLRQHYADDMVENIDNWTKDLREVNRARKKIADRKASVAKTAEQLSKLGFTP